MSETTDLQTLYKFIEGLEILKERLENAKKIEQQRVFLENQLHFAQETQQKLPQNEEINKKNHLIPGCGDFLLIKTLEEKINTNEIHEEDAYQIMFLTVSSLLYGIYEYYKNCKSDKKNPPLTNLQESLKQLEQCRGPYNIISPYKNNFDACSSYCSLIGSTPYLPESVYDSKNLQQQRHSSYKLTVARLPEFLLYFTNSCYSEYHLTKDSRELQKFVNSLISTFKKYCPSVTINLYFKYNIHMTQIYLQDKRYEGITQKKRNLESQLTTLQSMIPQNLIQKCCEMVGGPER